MDLVDLERDGEIHGMGSGRDPTSSSQPSSGQPSRGQQSSGQQSSGQQSSGQPSSGQQSSGQPSSSQPSSGQPSSGHQSSGQPSSGQPSSGQPSSGQLISGQSSRLQNRLTDGTKKCSPVLGMKYLTEYQSTSGSVVAFTCSLCYASIAEGDIIPHITSYQHRYNFFKLERPALWVQIDGLGKQEEKEGMVQMLAIQAPPTDGDVKIVSFTSTSVQQMLRQLSLRVMTLKTHMPVGSLVSTLKDSNIDREISAFQRSIKSPTPLLGLRFLLEVVSKIPGAGSLTKSTYICHCCNQTLPMENIMIHVTSFHHIANYFYLCHQEILTILFGADLTDDEFKVRCVECGKGIESKEGWDQVLCVTKDEFMLLSANWDTDVLKVTGKVTEMTVSQLEAKMNLDTLDDIEEDGTESINSPEEMSPPTTISKPVVTSSSRSTTAASSSRSTAAAVPSVTEANYRILSRNTAPSHSTVTNNRPTQDFTKNKAIVSDGNEQIITSLEAARLKQATSMRQPPRDKKWVIDTDNKSVLSCYIKENNMNEPVLGLEYITEYRYAEEEVRYRCELCNLFQTQIKGPRVCSTHITGFKHRMAYLARKHRLWFDDIIMMNDIGDKREKCQYYCEIIAKNSGLGKMMIVYNYDVEEQNKTKASQQKVDTPVKDRSVQGSALGKRSHEDEKVKKGLADVQFYKLLKGNEVLVGLNYLTEIHQSATDNTVLKYTCSLCNYTCTKAYIITHMEGLVHRDKFLEKVYPMLHKKALHQRTSVFHFSKDIQSQFGREPINLKWQTSTNSKGEPVYSTPISTRAYFTEEGIQPNQKKLKLATPTKVKSTTGKKARAFEKLTESMPKAVLIGLQYVTEIRHPTNDQLVCFECGLCKIEGVHTALTTRNVLRHISTKGHRINFFKETHEHLFKQIASAKNLHDRDNLIEKHSRDLEARVGRGEVIERVESLKFWSTRQAKQFGAKAEADKMFVSVEMSGQTTTQSGQTKTQAPVGKKTEIEESVDKPDNTPVRVLVCHVDSPSMFNVQYVSQQPKLSKLSQDIQKFCRSVQCGPVGKLTGGEKVLARSVQDGRWHRAIIRYVDSIHPDTKIKVRYVDVGHEEELSSDRLRQTTGAFAQDPFYAIRCSLANIVPRNKGNSWMSEAVQVFSTLVKNKEMNMVVIRKQSTPQLVELYKCDDGKTRVHDILITQRHGEPGVPTPELMFSDSEPNKTKPFISQKVRQILAQRKTSVESWRRASSNLERKIENGEVRLSFRPSKFKAAYAWLNKEHQIFAGLELVTEVQHEDETVDAWYLCKLCEERIDSKNICSHVQSQKHKILYIEKRDIEMFWVINRTEVLSSLVDGLVKELHTKVGGLPQDPSVWLQRNHAGIRVQDGRTRPIRAASPGKPQSRKESGQDRERVKQEKRSHSKSDRGSEKSDKRSRSPDTVKAGQSKRPRTDKSSSDAPEVKIKSEKSVNVNPSVIKNAAEIIDLTDTPEAGADEDLEGSVDDSFDGMSEFEFEAIDELGNSSDEDNPDDCVVTADHIKVKSEPENTTETGEEKAADKDSSRSIGINDVMTYVNKSCYGGGAKKKVSGKEIVIEDDVDMDKDKAGESLPEKKNKEKVVVVSVDIGGKSKDKVEQIETVGLELNSRSGAAITGKVDDNIKGNKEVAKAGEGPTKMKNQKVVVSVDIGVESKDKMGKVETVGLELNSGSNAGIAGNREPDSDIEDMDENCFGIEWDVVDEVGEDEEIPEIDISTIKTEEIKPTSSNKRTTDVVVSIGPSESITGRSANEQRIKQECQECHVVIGPCPVAAPSNKEVKPSQSKEAKPIEVIRKVSEIKTEVVVDLGPSSGIVAAPGIGRREGEVNLSVDMITRTDKKVSGALTKKNEPKGGPSHSSGLTQHLGAKKKPTPSTGSGQQGKKPTSGSGSQQAKKPTSGSGNHQSPRGSRASTRSGRYAPQTTSSGKQGGKAPSSTNKSGSKSGGKATLNTSNIKSEKKKENDKCEIVIVLD